MTIAMSTEQFESNVEKLALICGTNHLELDSEGKLTVKRGKGVLSEAVKSVLQDTFTLLRVSGDRLPSQLLANSGNIRHLLEVNEMVDQLPALKAVLGTRAYDTIDKPLRADHSMNFTFLKELVNCGVESWVSLSSDGKPEKNEGVYAVGFAAWNLCGVNNKAKVKIQSVMQYLFTEGGSRDPEVRKYLQANKEVLLQLVKKYSPELMEPFQAACRADLTQLKPAHVLAMQMGRWLTPADSRNLRATCSQVAKSVDAHGGVDGRVKRCAYIAHQYHSGNRDPSLLKEMLEMKETDPKVKKAIERAVNSMLIGSNRDVATKESVQSFLALFRSCNLDSEAVTKAEKIILDKLNIGNPSILTNFLHGDPILETQAFEDHCYDIAKKDLSVKQFHQGCFSIEKMETREDERKTKNAQLDEKIEGYRSRGEEVPIECYMARPSFGSVFSNSFEEGTHKGNAIVVHFEMNNWYDKREESTTIPNSMKRALDRRIEELSKLAAEKDVPVVVDIYNRGGEGSSCNVEEKRRDLSEELATRWSPLATVTATQGGVGKEYGGFFGVQMAIFKYHKANPETSKAIVER
ncbi:MAG: hypothetical protein P0S95_06700 [Rhabdochlamydiaceae bacterium]|nr:hypothetical protein [Candidatus Amphrikana amoebophyrae]